MSRRVPWWLYLLAFDAIVIFSTFYVKARFPGASSWRPLSLASEHSVATWFAGFQLLVFALLAHSISLDLRTRDGRAGRGYWLLSLIGLLLFFDEIGSIHERAEFFVPLPDDFAVLPLGFVAGVFLLYALVLAWRSRAITGNAVWFVVAGFLSFAGVYALEIAEGMRLSRLVRALRFAVEEGTELLGFLFLLAAIVSTKKRLGVYTGSIGDFLPRRRTLVWCARLCLILCVPVIALRAQFTADELVIPRRGDFGAAIPILLYACAAFMALEHGLNATLGAWRWWLLSAVLLTLSIDAEYHLHRLLDFVAGASKMRNDISLLWGLPVLTAALACVPAFRQIRLLLAAAAILVIAVISIGYSSDALILIVLPYLTSFGAFFLLSGHLEPARAR